jgi:hypothetical protein
MLPAGVATLPIHGSVVSHSKQTALLPLFGSLGPHTFVGVNRPEVVPLTRIGAFSQHPEVLSLLAFLVQKYKY